VSAPLVINLRDGSVWERRAVTRDGVALYALAGSCKCPEYVMATESELAAMGIAGSADALPVPVGPEPQTSPVNTDRAKAPWGRGEDGRPLLPMGAHWTDIPELVDKRVAGIQGRVDEAQGGSWYVAPLAVAAPDTVCTRVDGYHRTVGRFSNVLASDLDLVLHAHDDLSWCLSMVAKLRARVAELEAAAAPLIVDADGSEPIPLRWGLNDVQWGDDDSVTVMLSGPNGEPYWLELDAEQAPVLRTDLAGSDGERVFRAQHDSIVMGHYTNRQAAYEHCEAFLRRESPTAWFDWAEAEGGVAELTVRVDGEDLETGYTVTALEVASEYDGGDE
jgi:hypothetical protein